MEENKVKKRKSFSRRPKTEKEKQHLRDIAKAKWQDPAYKAKFNEGYSKVKDTLPDKVRAASAKISEGLRASWTEERKEKASYIYKESWSKDAERKARTASRMKEYWSNPEQAAARSEAISIARSTEEAKIKTSKHIKTVWQNPEHRENISNLMQEVWKDKSYKDRVLKHTQAVTKSSTLELIIEELKNKKDSISGLCQKYGFSHTSVLRILRANGQHDLINNHYSISSPQQEIADYITSLGFELSINNRKIISPKEVDIYVSSKNLAIEFNGLYWHSSAAPNFKRGKHYDKTLLCQKAGLRLFAIFEDEWHTKKDLIKVMLAHRLGVSSAIRLFARKLELVELKAKECKEFHDKHHLDGGLSYKGFGLKFNGEIVAALSVRKYKNGVYKDFTEVARFATHASYNVIGGVSRLLSKINGGIISYSNNRLSNGDVYKKLGFVEDTVSKTASYWYTDYETRVFRTKCQRNNNPEVIIKYPTEELQALNGVFSQKLFGDDRALYRIEDYGHKRWVIKN